MTFFVSAATNLEIDVDDAYVTDGKHISGPILNAIKKYEKHPSIIKITENINVNNKFTFSTLPSHEVEVVVNSFDIPKPTTYCNTPTKIFKQNFDICSGIITNIYNNCTVVPNFPSIMKHADVSPVHKKDNYTDGNNYRPVSILSARSKIFERLMYKEVASYMEKYLSSKLCGFRK